MYIPETDSTNNLIREQFLDREDLFTVYTDFQTAGRGQLGNGWESERGRNLLFSTLLRDWHIPVMQQFFLNRIVSLSLYYAVLPILTPEQQPLLAVKWPNDLYFGDRKLAGILIENIWQGSEITRSIAGIGLNVNQTEFRSSAPNPVSLHQITGTTHDREPILQRFLDILQHYRLFRSASVPTREHPAGYAGGSPAPVEYATPSWSADVPVRINMTAAQIASDYMRVLYRREGQYLWEEREVSLTPSMPQTSRNGNQFLARIHSVLPTGELVLRTADNTLCTYHFKQIRYVL